ncbi:helix-turn-helix transcriptional regulator [Chelatococcus reniformis]|uniref:HTH luxR-type domain-containing protein n=1 Tax=Chelatococcus reniformis TaxID=1494448 RepID=A0A916TZ62_9HYPH|nr:response regulator transcription factor [Chelatococcus reniformis]GGC52490.1 hypothetical protein GCM10010994_09430 [Chelatococcus reniformis]
MSTQATATDRLRRSVSSTTGAAAQPARFDAVRASAAPVGACTVMIEDRVLYRECVGAALQAMDPGHRFQVFDSVGAWAQSAEARRTALLILWMSASDQPTAVDGVFAGRLKQVLAAPAPPPVAVMSDLDRPDCVAHAIDSGARAFLPTSMGVDVAAKVLAIVRAGGSFIPASALAAMAPAGDGPARRAAELASLLSPRQLAIARAIRRGGSNKAIAYDLAMSESTVKVNVKAMMRKLNARNRTELALATRALDAAG